MSTQPRKERKTLHNLPVHENRAKIAAHLDEPLLLKYNTRSVTLRKGDTVRVLRGEYAGTSGKIVEINARQRKVTVDGVTVTKADASQKPRPLDPSNLLITKLNLEDPLRREKLGATTADVEEEPAPAKKAAKKSPAKAEEPEEATEADDEAAEKESVVADAGESEEAA
jgi:large subunit ribosomal protein L24